ncbi:MAG: DUF4011 domain-containing protein, partial [Verrucomicrobiota bacterium]
MDTEPKRSDPNSVGSKLPPDLTEKLRRSRQKLLDLTLRNRLLNFKPGNPNFRDDQKGHKHLSLKGKTDAVWESLVEKEKRVEVVCLTKDQQLRLQSEREQLKAGRRSEALNHTLARIFHKRSVLSWCRTF